MVLPGAAAAPAPVRRPARGDPTAEQAQRAAVREPDDGAAPRGDVASSSDDAVAADQVERGVHGESLRHAVEVEPEPGGTREQPPGEAECPPAPARRRAGRPLLVVRQEGEITVVAGGLDREAERRVDEPAGGRGGAECIADDGREELRDDEYRRGVAIDAVELAPAPEAGENAVPALKEAGDSFSSPSVAPPTTTSTPIARNERGSGNARVDIGSGGGGRD